MSHNILQQMQNAVTQERKKLLIKNGSIQSPVLYLGKNQILALAVAAHSKAAGELYTTEFMTYPVVSVDKQDWLHLAESLTDEH